MSDNPNNREPLISQYPSNSKVRPNPPPASSPEERHVEKVVTGSVVQRKPSLGRKFAESFLGDDTKSVGGYILHDVVIPTVKSLISDMVGGGIEMLLFGDRRPRSSSIRREGGRTYTNYGGYSRPSYREDRDVRDRERRDLTPRERARHDFNGWVITDRREAEDVLAGLVDLIIDYKEATVADFYSLAGITSEFPDRTWGWTDLRDARVNPVRGGWIIDLPRPRPLD